MNNGTEQLYLLSSIQPQPPGPIQKQDAMQGTTPRNLENVQDFSNVCRICATVTQLVVPIFAGEGLEHQLADKIHKHLPVRVAETDQLPLVVCYQCVSTLMAWHELVECSVQADRALKARIGMTARTEDVKRETHSTIPAPNMKTEEDSQSQLNNVNNCVQPTELPAAQPIRVPPKYTPPRQLCEFCNTTHPEETFVKHLLVEHYQLLFHCFQCDKYISKMQYGAHMARHAEQRAVQRQFDVAMNWTSFARPNYNILLPITFNRYTYASAQVSSEENINRTVLVTSNQSIDTTALTRNEEIKIVAAVTPCQNDNVSIAVTPHDNSDTIAEVMRNQDLNNTAAPAKCDSTQQNDSVTTVIPNPNTDTTAPITVNKLANAIVLRSSHRMGERITHTPITSQVTRNRSNNIEALVTRNQKSNVAPITIKPDTTSIGSGGRTTKHNQENEFSDHSDMEYGFGPLPESVFEAIEDTQDSQSAEDSNQIADTEHVSDDATPVSTDSSSKQPASKKTRKCPICSKVYHASSSYFYHLKHTHKRVKDHECKICTKKFATRASLAAHTTTHTGECQFECKHCKKRFRSNASLYIHEQTHNGIKRFSCQQCDTSFRWKTHLLRHIKRHAAEKSHVCTTCGRGFSIRCDLLRHMRTHSAGEYACEECDVKFAQMRYLKVHMEKKHSKNTVKKPK